MEEQSRAETLHREAARKVQIKEQVGEYEKIRRETKRQKRSLNIEIASGVIDLIMDMADEVYAVVAHIIGPAVEAGSRTGRRQYDPPYRGQVRPWRRGNNPRTH